jgi:hypothetical protein
MKDGIDPVLSLLKRIAFNDKLYVFRRDAEFALTICNFGYLNLMSAIWLSQTQIQCMLDPFALFAVFKIGAGTNIVIFFLQVEHERLVEPL